MSETPKHDREERSLTDVFSELIADGTLDPVIDHLQDGAGQEVDTIKHDLDEQLLNIYYARATEAVERQVPPLLHAPERQDPDIEAGRDLTRAAQVALELSNVRLAQSSRQLGLARYTARKRLSSSE